MQCPHILQYVHTIWTEGVRYCIVLFSLIPVLSTDPCLESADLSQICVLFLFGSVMVAMAMMRDGMGSWGRVGGGEGRGEESFCFHHGNDYVHPVQWLAWQRISVRLVSCWTRSWPTSPKLWTTPADPSLPSWAGESFRFCMVLCKLKSLTCSEKLLNTCCCGTFVSDPSLPSWAGESFRFCMVLCKLKSLTCSEKLLNTCCYGTFVSLYGSNQSIEFFLVSANFRVLWVDFRGKNTVFRGEKKSVKKFVYGWHSQTVCSSHSIWLGSFQLPPGSSAWTRVWGKMAACERKIVDQMDTVNDKGCPLKWEWVEFQVKVGESTKRIGSHIRKLNSTGRAFCTTKCQMPKFIFGRGALPPWTPQRGVAPAPHRGLNGPWTPAYLPLFFSLPILCSEQYICCVCHFVLWVWWYKCFSMMYCRLEIYCCVLFWPFFFNPYKKHMWVTDRCGEWVFFNPMYSHQCNDWSFLQVFLPPYVSVKAFSLWLQTCYSCFALQSDPLLQGQSCR